MGKVKTTVYLDEDVLRAARVWAARKDLRDSEVMERALRQFLGMDLIDRVWERNAGTDESTALIEAYAGVRDAVSPSPRSSLQSADPARHPG